MRTEVCPHCTVSLQGKPIPESQREFYGDATHYSRTVGVEIRGVYDGILLWQCPDCHGRWPRWTKADSPRLFSAAARYINGNGYRNGKPIRPPMQPPDDDEEAAGW